MELFEVHITGSKSILEAAQQRNIKAISVELLKPDKSVLYTEHMTSQVYKFKNLDECKNKVKELTQELSRHAEIYRVKIETPYYEHYKKESLYIESHFPSTDKGALSRNTKKIELLGTAREYEIGKYDEFRKTYMNKDIELCLYDSNVNLDKEWLELYE